MHNPCMIYDILLSAGVALACTVLVLAGLARSVWLLQCDVEAIKAQFLKLRNTNAAATRWKDKESLELLNQLEKNASPVPPKNPLAKFGITR